MNILWPHLNTSDDLVTPYEATRAGFVALALEKNRRATPYVAEARALHKAVANAQSPTEVLHIKGIEAGLLAAAGVSDKARHHLLPQDRIEAIQGLVENFLEPAGAHFVEELIFRFLLNRGDSLGGSMRNVGGMVAQRKFARAILATLTVAGLNYRWQHTKSRQWLEMTDDDTDIELALRGLAWPHAQGWRTLLFNLTVPLVRNNVDLCLLASTPDDIEAGAYNNPVHYLALGELKGGIDPAGADEHWKTANAALERLHAAFALAGATPKTFFVGAAIEKKMALEIWAQLQTARLNQAANLTNDQHMMSLARWLVSL